MSLFDLLNVAFEAFSGSNNETVETVLTPHFTAAEVATMLLTLFSLCLFVITL